MIVAEDYPGGNINRHNIYNYRRTIFEKVLGEKFGHEAIILEPKSTLFLELLKEMELKIKDLSKDNPKEFTDHRLDRYDEKVTFFGQEFVVNGRSDYDRELVDFHEFTKKLNGFMIIIIPYTLSLLLKKMKKSIMEIMIEKMVMNH